MIGAEIMCTRKGMNMSSLRMPWGYLVFILSITQILAAFLPMLLGIGEDMRTVSARNGHPLVPSGMAFSIWGVIYSYSFIAAITGLFLKSDSPATDKVLLRAAAIMYGCNTLWSLWVPVFGFDELSLVVIFVSALSGISALIMTGPLMRSLKATLWFFGPLALLTGWTTAASVLNLTSYLVSQSAFIDPTNPVISAVFLGFVIFAGAVLTLIIKSRLYPIPVLWALFWVMHANSLPESPKLMADTAGIGIMIVGCAALAARLRLKLKSAAA
jgi:hypothetical protein